MKKILTLLFAVVTVAAFAAPTVQKVHKLQPQKSEAKIEMRAQMGDLYTGKAGMTKDFTSGVDTMYLAPRGTFFSAFFPYSDSFFYSYNLALVPGNTELTWTNISTGIASDTYDWVYFNPGLDEEYLTMVEGEKDLVCTFPNYPGWWIAPSLYANAYSQADDEAGNYYAFDGALFMGGKFEDDVNGDGTTLTGMYQFSPRADYADIMRTQFSAGYSEDVNNFFTDLPSGYQVEGAADGKIQNFIQYFNYPGKPYAFSRIQFYAYCNAEAGNTLVAKVCKVEDGTIDIDNPINEAVYEFPADVTDETTAIDFFFEKEDPELGLTEEDWMIIDGDIAIVIEGVNDVEEVSPILNAMTRVADLAHDEFYQEYCGGYALWYFFDSEGSAIDARIIPCHLGYYWGSGDDSGLPENLLLSINAQFAYIETVADNATEYTIPAEGGQFTLELKASEAYDAWAVDDIPSWITITATDELDEEDNSYTGYTTLTINVQPNNNGTIVYSLPGTEFKIIVGNGGNVEPQYPVGDVDGSGVVDIEDVNAAINIILKVTTTDDYPGSADLDNSGVVDISDVNAIINIILKI